MYVFIKTLLLDYTHNNNILIIIQKIVSNLNVFAATLSEIMNIDDDTSIKNVVNFFNYRNLFTEFVKAAISHDIFKTSLIFLALIKDNHYYYHQ